MVKVNPKKSDVKTFPFHFPRTILPLSTLGALTFGSDVLSAVDELGVLSAADELGVLSAADELDVLSAVEEFGWLTVDDVSGLRPVSGVLTAVGALDVSFFAPQPVVRHIAAQAVSAISFFFIIITLCNLFCVVFL